MPYFAGLDILQFIGSDPLSAVLDRDQEQEDKYLLVKTDGDFLPV